VPEGASKRVYVFAILSGSNTGHSLSVYVQDAFVADLIFRNGFED